MDLQGFSQLKLLISSHLSHYQDEKEQIDYNYPFKEKDTHYQIASKMSTLYEQTIISTKNLIDLDVFVKVVSALEKANHIVMFPSAGNINVAKNFQFHMKGIGKQVEVEVIPYLQYMSAIPLKKGDVAIVISYVNRATGMIDIIRELKKQGVYIVLISSTLPNDLFSYATYHLFCCPYENRNEKIASFTSILSLQYLLDTLYACYFHRHYKENIDFKLNHIKVL